MKYIIIDNDTEGTINEITNDPIDFIRQFEPMDVVDGKLLALDEEGRDVSL